MGNFPSERGEYRSREFVGLTLAAPSGIGLCPDYATYWPAGLLAFRNAVTGAASEAPMSSALRLFPATANEWSPPSHHCSVAFGPILETTPSSRSRVAKVSRVPWRNSMGVSR